MHNTHDNPLPTTPAPGHKRLHASGGKHLLRACCPSTGLRSVPQNNLGQNNTRKWGLQGCYHCRLSQVGMLHVSGSAASVRSQTSQTSQKSNKGLHANDAKQQCRVQMQLSNVAKMHGPAAGSLSASKKEWEVHAACCNKCCGCRNPLGAAREKVPSIPHKPPPHTASKAAQLAVRQAHGC
jgi:hypothetical protein